MPRKNTLLLMVLVSASIFSVVLVYSLYQHSQKIESEFNEKKASLIREKLDLEDRIESVQEIIDQKTEELALLEKEKKSLEDELKVFKEETKRQIQAYSEELERLKVENASLNEKIAALEKKPLLQRIGGTLHKEKDENVRKVLKKALDSINLIRTGKSIELEPIVVATKEEQRPSLPSFTPPEVKIKRIGEVLFLDKSYNIVVINLGRRDNVRGGERCLILKDGKEIAKGEIVSIRYRVSAAFIDEVSDGYSFSAIKEGCDVLVLE